MTRATYIHGTEASEQRRLVELNRLTNEAFVAFLDVEPGARVLEVGSGLGILAGRVAEDDAAVVGVELSAEQLAAAETSTGVVYVRGDAQALAFKDKSFDVAYARFLLEHVREPQTVLSEIHRVLRPGGRVAVLENDISLVRFDPPCPAFDRVWTAFAGLQADLGGDGFIGRRLFGLLKTAGFRDIELSVQPEMHWQGSPAWEAWVTNIIGNVASARAALISFARCEEAEIDAAMTELRFLIRKPDGSSNFVWNRARGVR